MFVLEKGVVGWALVTIVGEVGGSGEAVVLFFTCQWSDEFFPNLLNSFYFDAIALHNFNSY